MRYFTPSLLDQYGKDDEFLEASDEWDRRSEEYRAYIDSLNLPPNTRKLSQLSFHDDELIQLSILPKDSICRLELKSDIDRKTITTVTYKLHGNNCIDMICYSPERDDGPPLQYWMYDEITASGIFFKHSILLTGSREIGITFSDVEIS
jgi:hypothetical protein